MAHAVVDSLEFQIFVLETIHLCLTKVHILTNDIYSLIHDS